MGRPLFVFGTLIYPPLLEAVVGDAAHLKLTPARLAGYRVSGVAGGNFPGIESHPDSFADGMTIGGLTAADKARLDFYEKAFDYAREGAVLDDGREVDVYLPARDRWTLRGPWSLDDWIRDESEISLRAAREVMEYVGRKTPGETGRMFPMIRARAWSSVNAGKSRHGAGTLHGTVTVTQHERPYASYFAVDEYMLRHERFDGTMSQEVLRAVFRAPDAALVLPYDPVRDRVLVVEQIRMGPLARGDRSLWQFEPVAGRLDPGEAPQDAARREAHEEAGLEIGEMWPIAETYCSPGNSSEFYYIYLGFADLPDRATGTGGLEAEHEDIRSHLLSFDALMTLCDAQRAANAPLVMAAYWLARHRDRLRRKAGITA